MSTMMTLMDDYAKAQRAEYRLEEAVIAAFGGIESCPFEDWWFDTYDHSVELTGFPVGRLPSAQELKKLGVAGIDKVYISYENDTAQVWYRKSDSVWGHGECSTREKHENNRAMVLELKKQLRDTRRAVCQAFDDWAEVISEKPPDSTLSASSVAHPGSDMTVAEFKDFWNSVRGLVGKSCLLDRMVYGGEKPSRTPCPVHKGIWSGVAFERPACGCADHSCSCTTGWLVDEASGRGQGSVGVFVVHGSLKKS